MKNHSRVLVLMILVIALFLPPKTSEPRTWHDLTEKEQAERMMRALAGAYPERIDRVEYRVLVHNALVDRFARIEAVSTALRGLIRRLGPAMCFFIDEKSCLVETHM